MADQFPVRLPALLVALLHYRWQRECEILPAYLPPFPTPTTRPECVIRYRPTGRFLRYSQGPRAGLFWDIYGDDFISPELALVMLATQAPSPTERAIHWEDDAEQATKPAEGPTGWES